MQTPAPPTTSRWKKNTIAFLTSQILSLLGSSLVQFAITVYITRTTLSGAYTTLSIICGFLPAFFLSPFAGVWADRYSKKTLILLSDGGIAISTLLLAIAFLLGHQYIWLLLAASALRSLGSAVQTPAVNAILPEMVPSQQLTRVNGINRSAQSLLTLLSPMLAALLLGLPLETPLILIFFIDVITAALAICVMLFFTKLPIGHKIGSAHGAAKSHWHDMKEGLSYIRKTPYLMHLFGFCTVFYIMMAPPAFLTQLQVARSFGPEYWRLSAIEVVFSAGMLLGGLLISVWQGFQNRVHTMVLAGLLLSLSTFLMGLPVHFILYCIFMLLMGLAMPLFDTPAVVVLQQRVAPEMMGRIFSVLSMLSSSLMPLGMLLFGPLADKIPIEWLLLFSGAIMTIIWLFLLKDRPLLEAGKPLEADSPTHTAQPL